MHNLVLSPLAHTWILDVDGTLFVHNGYKNGGDKILDGVKDFFAQIPSGDMIIIITSRTENEKENLEALLKNNNLRYDYIIFNAPMGERILVNDDKPSGLKMAHVISKKRDANLDVCIKIDESF